MLIFLCFRYKDKTATFDMDIDESLFEAAAKADPAAEEIDESLFAAEAESGGNNNNDEANNDGGGNNNNNSDPVAE